MNPELETLVKMKYGQMRLSIEYADSLPAEFYKEFYIDQMSRFSGGRYTRELAEHLLETTNHRIGLLIDLQMHTSGQHELPLPDRIHQWLIEYESRA